jgi:hypothetical protein
MYKHIRENLDSYTVPLVQYKTEKNTQEDNPFPLSDSPVTHIDVSVVVLTKTNGL